MSTSKDKKIDDFNYMFDDPNTPIDPNKFTPIEMLKNVFNGLGELKKDLQDLNVKIDSRLDSIDQRVSALESKSIQDDTRRKRNLRLYQILTWVFGAILASLGLIFRIIDKI